MSETRKKFVAAIDLLISHRVGIVGVEGSASWGALVASALSLLVGSTLVRSPL